MLYKAEELNEQVTWQDLTPGCEIYEAGTSRLTHTGEWRSRVPVWNVEKCKQCLMCTPYCPDGAIPVSDGRRRQFDLDYCKGCGICVKVCPFNAIDLKEVM